MLHPIQVLIIADRAAHTAPLMREVRRAGFDPKWVRVATETDYLANLRPDLDLILSHCTTRVFSSSRALELLRERDWDVPFIVISSVAGEEAAVAAMKSGASDYLMKNRLSRLGTAVAEALDQASLRRTRRQAGRLLHEHAASAEDALNSLAAEVAVVDESGTITAANEAWKRFARENGGRDYIGENYLSVCEEGVRNFAAPDALTVGQGLRSVLDGSAQDFVMEYPCHSPTEERWFQMRISPLLGERRGAVVAHESITKRRKAEEALRLFRNLVDQSIDTFEVVDLETGRFLDVNEKACAELGYSRAEYLSMRVFDVDTMVKEADWPEVVAHLRAAGSLSRVGLLRRRKDGSTFPIEINAKWVRLERDYIIAVVRDVTDRVKAEERVREQAAMLDLAHDAIIVRGFDDRKVSFWSRGAENLYGWTVAEATGRDIAELIFVDQAVPVAIRKALLTAEEWRGENRHKTRDGRQIHVNTRATLIRDSSGAPRSILSINTDVTEQKRLEARYLLAQRMESIGALAGGVAHDLGNILSPITICAPLLRRGATAETREELISTIELSAERGLKIVRQILNFGRRMESERIPLHVDDLIGGLMRFIRGTFPKNLRIESELQPRLCPVVGDATQLHQVLLNLCVNARDAMPDGGSLRVLASNLEVDVGYASMLFDVKPGWYVMFEVADTGVGIPPRIVEQIFEPFFTTKGSRHGTGLGLSTALGIVQNHGGFINVKTQLGEGSVFQVCLPASSNRCCAAGNARRARPARGKGELILMVDDEAEVRRAARIGIESGGYRVLLASDGAEALDVFNAHLADIAAVITDLNMPRMDGLAFIRALREVAPDVPIIISTGRSGKLRRAQLKAMNVETVLNKPYGTDTLLRAIVAAMRPAANPRQSRVKSSSQCLE